MGKQRRPLALLLAMLIMLTSTLTVYAEGADLPQGDTETVEESHAETDASAETAAESTVAAYAANSGEITDTGDDITDPGSDSGDDAGDVTEWSDILQDVEYNPQTQTATVYYTPYIEGKYDENNDPELKGTITVSLYKDTESNWGSFDSDDYDPLTEQISTASVGDIGMNPEPQKVEIPLDHGDQEYYFVQAVYAVGREDGSGWSEDLTTVEYTQDIQQVAKATVGNLTSSSFFRDVDEDHLVNLSPSEGDASSDFAVYRLGAYVFPKDFTPEKPAEGEDGYYSVSGLPDGFTTAYPDNAALQKVPGMVQRKAENGEGDDYWAFAQNSEDNYDVQYIYPDGDENAKPTGIRFKKNEDAGLEDVYEYFSYTGGTDGTDSAVAFQSAVSQAADTPAELAALKTTWEKPINEDNVKGTIIQTPSLSVDFEFKFGLPPRFNCTITADVETKYDLTVSKSSTEKHTVEMGTVSSPSVMLAGMSITGKFNVFETKGAGKISGVYNLGVTYKMGTSGFSANQYATNTTTEYWPDKDSGGNLYCYTEAACDINADMIEVSIPFVGKIGPVLTCTTTIADGTKYDGALDERVEENGQVHLCNLESGKDKGCAAGSRTDVMRNAGSFGVNLVVWKDSWKITEKKQEKTPEPFYRSKTYNELKNGTCPHWCKAVAPPTADPEEGVYKTKELKVKLSLDPADATDNVKIKYTMTTQDGQQEEQEYDSVKPLTITRDDKSPFVVCQVTAYAEKTQDGKTIKSETKEWTYILTNSDCLLVPEETTMAVDERQMFLLLYTGDTKAVDVKWTSSEEGVVTWDPQKDAVELRQGVLYLNVTGAKQGKTSLTATVGENKATAKITVTDELAPPTAKYGTNLYILQKLAENGPGLTYIDGTDEKNAKPPYVYHDKKHTVAEELNHISWGEAETTAEEPEEPAETEKPENAIEVYYTVDSYTLEDLENGKYLTEGISTPRKGNVATKQFKKGDKIYLSITKDKDWCELKVLRAVAYDPKKDKYSDVVTWYYIIVDKPSADAYIFMLPGEEHITQYSLGAVLAVYIPSITDFIQRENWTEVTPVWSETPIPHFCVKWKWKSEKWWIVPVLGTTEKVTEKLLGVDFVQTGIVFGLFKTGTDEEGNPDYVKIKATGKPLVFKDKSKSQKTGTAKIYVDERKEPEVTPTPTPTKTPEPGTTPTPTPTKTPEPGTTPTPTPTKTPEPGTTPTPTPTKTPEPGTTPTPTPTKTPEPGTTPTPTPKPGEVTPTPRPGVPTPTPGTTTQPAIAPTAKPGVVPGAVSTETPRSGSTPTSTPAPALPSGDASAGASGSAANQAAEKKKSAIPDTADRAPVRLVELLAGLSLAGWTVLRRKRRR